MGKEDQKSCDLNDRPCDLNDRSCDLNDQPRDLVTDQVISTTDHVISMTDHVISVTGHISHTMHLYSTQSGWPWCTRQTFRTLKGTEQNRKQWSMFACMSASNHHAGSHTCKPFLPCFPGSPKGPCKNKQRPTSLLHSRLGTLAHH